MANKIHKTSIVEKGAKIGSNVNIGPFCHIGENVELGDGVNLISHVSISGHTKIGNGARIFPFACVGSEPQDLKYKGEKSQLIIGENCLIREGVTINPGTKGGELKTVIGNNCALLANSHVAHDCLLGNNIILANGALIAGHCQIADSVIFGGGSAIHQFCRVGSHAFIGGLAAVEADVIPFGTVLGNRAHLAGLNLIGLKRANIVHASIHNLRAVFKQLFDGSATVQARAKELRKQADDKYAIEMLDFILNASKRALCVPL